MTKRIILIIFLSFVLLIINCSKKSPPTEPEEVADLTVNMLLKPATANGYNVTRVHVRITRNTFADSMDLTIDGESASGTFTGLKVGTYQIEVWVYEDTTLIATGSGTGQVKAGKTVNVTITVTFLTGNLGLTVNWGNESKGGILFEDFGITDSIFAYDSDWDAICDSIFGLNYRVADWNDLKGYYNNGGDLLYLFDGLGLTEYRDGASVKRDGNQFYSGSRSYFASRHEHKLPSGWLAHDNIDNYLISLGSWYHKRKIMVHKK